MKLLPLLLGLGLTLASVCGQPFDPKELEGEWHTIRLASSKKEKVEEEGSMRVFMEHMKALEDKSIGFKFHTIANEECVDHYVVADETTEPGEYSVEYDGHNKFTLLDADPGAYAIFYLTNFKDGKSFNLVALYAREPDVSQEIKNKFEELREKHGIPKANMVDLTQADTCRHA
ncbi:major urinary protein 20-like isoform X1 [Meriones unguiculatus]|uniref:major urinary protein 20-like isoform X1 n=1 Tax=Meriones unguiculatus TaxID=10047 RepID=UPI00293F52EC|nr:major urinary protein 20-like isoform X1 [Meriones unguiculatus]